MRGLGRFLATGLIALVATLSAVMCVKHVADGLTGARSTVKHEAEVYEAWTVVGKHVKDKNVKMWQHNTDSNGRVLYVEQEYVRKSYWVVIELNGNRREFEAWLMDYDSYQIGRQIKVLKESK